MADIVVSRSCPATHARQPWVESWALSRPGDKVRSRPEPWRNWGSSQNTDVGLFRST